MDEVLERHQRELLGGLSKEQLIEVLLDYGRLTLGSCFTRLRIRLQAWSG